QCRYLTDQLQKVQIVNEVNKDFVIEALRSIAELVTYGDQHDPSFFEFFMEEQIMSEFARILRISRPAKVAVQLLQTMSIMIQNLRSEHAIYYIFSNEHINFLITYSFDFRNEELLSYYVSFLRAISGKLNKNTISLLVKTHNDEVVSFPLYVEAIRFAFHEETMVRIAVRALTLNVYHVGDEYVNRYVSRAPLSDYFSKMVKYFWKQCASLDELVSQVARHPYPSDSAPSILAAVDEIEDNLYYFSDVISAGISDLGILITDNILQLLAFPLLLPSLKKQSGGAQIGITTSLYLLCCILHIFKSKDLASIIAATLFYPPEIFVMKFESSPNGYSFEHRVSQEHQQHDPYSRGAQAKTEDSGISMLDCSGSGQHFLPNHCSSQSDTCGSQCTLREVLLSYVSGGNDLEVLGSLSFLATLLQTKGQITFSFVLLCCLAILMHYLLTSMLSSKELDESMLDGLGILPQRKQHKKLLLQALVGEDYGEEQLFSSENSMMKDSMTTELDRYLHKVEVLDALVSLFCRSDVSADILWAGGWLSRQLLPHGEEEFTSLHLERLKDSNKHSTDYLLMEIKGSWCDLLVTVLKDQWKNCKRAIEASSPPKNPRSILLPSQAFSSGGESSFAAGERMCEMVKVFVLQRQLLFLSFGGTLADLPPSHSPIDSPVSSQAKTAGLDVPAPKPGCEINLEIVNSETVLTFLVFTIHQPRIDEKHSKWLHLRIRPSALSLLDPMKYDAFSKGKAKILADGRWTLAFRDEQSCKTAEYMVIEEINLQRRAVEQSLKPLLELDMPGHTPEPCTLEASTAEVG
ncbi:Protein TRANSPARENT TESTA 9, partial [Cocos nucifera]